MFWQFNLSLDHLLIKFIQVLSKNNDTVIFIFKILSHDHDFVNASKLMPAKYRVSLLFHIWYVSYRKKSRTSIYYQYKKAVKLQDNLTCASTIIMSGKFRVRAHLFHIWIASYEKNRTSSYYQHEKLAIQIQYLH